MTEILVVMLALAASVVAPAAEKAAQGSASSSSGAGSEPKASAKTAPNTPKASDPAKQGFEESLNYNINWPTGLSLGEAHLNTARRNTPDGPRVETEFRLDASVPGFPVMENHRSVADGEFCSIELKKQYTRGKRKAEETTKFDQQAKTAARETKDGGKSDLSISSCAKDALAYVSYLRRELREGRLPPHQPVYFGAAYQVKVEFTGTDTIRVADVPTEADRLVASIKGPSVDINVEVFFAKDAARTPLLVKVPLQLATFSMELAR